LSIEEERVVITKDTDFEDSFWLNGIPPKLILVTTGNTSNSDLLKIFENNFTKIVQFLSSNSFIEIDQQNVIIHS
jgi:predicted nuclease of predicted toxin-antitoxin system